MRKGYSVIEALNWYAYVSNNPVKYVDPTGMFEGSIDTAVDNNLDEEYISGENDCDQWVEDVLEESGYEVTEEDWWTEAKDANVAKHREDMKDVLQNEPEEGTNIGLSSDGHTILLHLNEDGSVEVAHTSSNNPSEKSEKHTYTGDNTNPDKPITAMEQFRNAWTGVYEFYPIPNTSSSSDEGTSSSVSSTESANNNNPSDRQGK